MKKITVNFAVCLVHLTTEKALLFAVPGALATLDLGLSTASVCTPICEITVAENGVIRFFAYNCKVIYGF